MRIVAGRFRGRPLAALGKGDPGAHLRPTTDRVREALFNMLGGGRFGDPFDGPVLDLFAGTGALGLEALSRGNSHATFVETGRKGQSLIAANIHTLDVGAVSQVLKCDARRLPAHAGEPARLVFLDPPYGKDMGAAALVAARQGGWIAPDALIVWEEAAAQETPQGFALLEHRRYGDSWITILEQL